MSSLNWTEGQGRLKKKDRTEMGSVCLPSASDWFAPTPPFILTPLINLFAAVVVDRVCFNLTQII